VSAADTRDELITLAAIATIDHPELSRTALMLAYAITYAEAGWPVFPLGRNKRPRIASPHPKGSPERKTCKGRCGRDGHGVHDATTNIATICRWWAVQYPSAGIAAAIPPGVFVLDTDPRKPGYVAAARLLAAHGALPPTLMTVSGRLDGGCHYFYLAPPGELAGNLLVPGFEQIPVNERGFDLKGHGGYTVMPPTLHPVTGHPYIAVDAPIVGAGWLDRFVIKPPRRQRSAQQKFWRASAYRGRRGESVADWYTDNHTWAQVLEPHGWETDDGDGDSDGDCWLHPTATSECSATISRGLLFVYSTSTVFEPTAAGNPHGYTKFRAYAELNFNGDLSAAARSLRKAA
jgi:Bifunctional DNA primase/polymerase, N-terminal